jgi:hypothetical protein
VFSITLLKVFSDQEGWYEPVVAAPQEAYLAYKFEASLGYIVSSSLGEKRKVSLFYVSQFNIFKIVCFYKIW